MTLVEEKIAVLGLGYVGLPLALSLAEHFSTIGFDTDPDKANKLRNNPEVVKSNLRITDNASDLKNRNFFIVAVQTPLNAHNQPDLSFLVEASEIIASVISHGGIVVYESTVYPGVTEDICRKIIANKSCLKQGTEFKVGYSPERINPGDENHTLEKTVKVIAGEDLDALERIERVYGKIIQVGLYRAKSIKVAEMAKVVENTQRDLNIALINEISIICNKLEIRTRDVLDAAKTKWNFLDFNPGLVGGHCIAVDPYYLIAKSEELSYHPEVILAGRRVNQSIVQYLGQKLINLLVQANIGIANATVGILGITYKENFCDIRNSRVPDLVSELKDFGINPLIYDPLADFNAVKREYNLELVQWEKLTSLDAIILAVPHRVFIDKLDEFILSKLKSDGVLMDIKSVVRSETLPYSVTYWSL